MNFAFAKSSLFAKAHEGARKGGMDVKATKQLANKMIVFFQNYDAAEGVPSFEKFADTVGCDGEELRRLSEDDASFARAYRRCLSILRDRLTDGALLRRYDSSFCKYALDSLNDADVNGGDNAPLDAVEVRVIV